ncbi:thiopeptide-type bacteriocin biosynthesis protein [Streptomyces sp. NPDC058953]|uniref:thiopeptide-type bacteriocin biosynthesis protein n=1 Tax=unclassified Streptomyces TaxID=2593676 RepID=UPI0036A0FF3E
MPPGSGWLSAALAVPVRHQDAALRQLAAPPAAARLYWLRYRTPALGPQLRLRYCGPPDALREIRHMLLRWGSGLAEQGLSDGHLHYEPYIRETPRYGGPGAVDAAEDVFAADSALALTVLVTETQEGAEPHRLPLAAICAVAVARALTAPGAVPEVVRGSVRGGPLTRAERHERDRLRTAARSHRLPSWLTEAWSVRQKALAAYGDVLPDPDIAGRCASDLVHLSCNRLLGADAGLERVARSLATDLLYAHD